jgi:hypothetical protein
VLERPAQAEIVAAIQALPPGTGSGSTVSFDHAQFSGGTVDFQFARSPGGQVSFADAVFSGGEVEFSSATRWSHPPVFSWGGKPPTG